MTHMSCEDVSDRLAELAGDRAPDGALDAHIQGCRACAGELALLAALRAGTPAAPAGLRESILARVADVEPSRAWAWSAPRLVAWRAPRLGPWWGAGALAAAGLAAVVIGGALLRGEGPGAEAAELLASSEVELDGPALAEWPGADGLLAGAPVLAELSEEELETLLEEMES
ncbi:MAG TPA: hypothetical protein VMK65_11480 [Longimicrobiales bacterium]|nr:hypothetical protein [Longimicrobiales bacterium]